MVIVETSFPRGGTVKPRTETTNITFGARQEKRKKSKPNKKQREQNREEENVEKEKPIQAISAELLSHKTIQEGMLIMGTVKHVDPTYLKISLPGRIVGKVLANAISDSYNKVISRYVEGKVNSETFKPLTELFHIGQTIYTKVMEIVNHESGHLYINLSLKPADVHSNFNHETIRKGMLFNGAIEEVQDHGYIIETGVKNLRCFLPLEKIEETLTVGQLICVKVEKLTQSATASTAICKAIVGENRKIKDLAEPNLDYIMPATVINFTVEKILKDGLQGTIMNGQFIAYVNEHQFDDPMKDPEDYDLNSTISARLLYVMPLTKLVYLSLNLKEGDEESAAFQRGEVVEEATVHRIGTGGIILNLQDKGKGLISFKSIKANYTGNYDQDELLTKYKKHSKHKVRVIEYDQVDSLYICTDNPVIVNEKFYTLEDLKPGEFVTAVVQEKDKDGGYFVTVGKVRGLIEKMFLTTTSTKLAENTRLRCRVIWINPERNIAYLTNRPEYMNKNAKLLTQRSSAKPNKIFVGTIVKSLERIFIVRFFNGIKGILYKNQLSGFLTGDFSAFDEGETMNFRIVSKTDDKLIVGLADDIHKIGELCQAKVTNVIQTGLQISIEDENQTKGLVPARLVSDFPELAVAHLKTYDFDDEVEVTCIMRNIYSIRDVEHFKNHPPKVWSDIKPGDIMKGYIKNVDNDIIEVLMPIQNYEKLVKVHLKMFLEHCLKAPNIVLVPDQVVYLKVLGKETLTKSLTVSAKLADVWDYDLKKSTGNWFAQYLDEIKKIRKGLKAKERTIASYKLGDTITVKAIGYDTDTKEWNLITPENNICVIRNLKENSLKIKQEVKAVVLWVDYSTDRIYLSNKPKDMEIIGKGLSLPANFRNSTGINAKILLTMNDFVLCSMKKGPNPLVFIPSKLHFNDFENTSSLNAKEGEFCRLSFIHEKYPIAVFDSTFKLWSRIKAKKRTSESLDTPLVTKKAKTLKNKEPAEGEVVVKRNYVSLLSNINNESDEAASDEDVTMEDVENSSTSKKQPKKREKNFDPILPGANNFWATDLEALNKSVQNETESSDEDEEDQNATNAKKKKKQTAAERFKAEREEEARLRQIEENNANPNMQPETADQFDRLVLTNPNNSITWINYMVHHLQATEIDKARAVARRALKAISFREEQEIINIWVALLNLELRYGTKESFNDILKESTLCNDPYKIYTRCLQILSDAKKSQELTEIIPIATRKFRDKMEIWKNAANAYFEADLPEKGKQLLHKALAALPERDHINTIVAFANLHYKHNDKETAHTLLEQIVTSYPKRVDVWSQYVDMLIKDNEIESARRTLERSVVQKIPLKKMRTLFKKYLEFEEKYGDEESVQNVKEMAANYVKKEINS